MILFASEAAIRHLVCMHMSVMLNEVFVMNHFQGQEHTADLFKRLEQYEKKFKGNSNAMEVLTMMKDKLSKDDEEDASAIELGEKLNAGVSQLVLLFQSYFHSMKSKMQHSWTLKCSKRLIGHIDQ